MKTKVFSSIIIVLLSLMSGLAFGQTPMPVIYDNDPNSIKLSKSVSPDGSDIYKYWLELTAFVTGTEVMYTNVPPVDFVLLLDLSGSMSGSAGSTYYPNPTQSLTYNNYKFKRTDIGTATLYYKHTDGKFYPVDHFRNENKYFVRYYAGGKYYYLHGSEASNPYNISYGKDSADDVIYDGGNLFTTTRMDAMRSAVKSFIDAVAKTEFAPTSGNHRISIIKFASYNSSIGATRDVDQIGNEIFNFGSIGSSSNIYNLTQVVTDLTEVSPTNVTLLKQQMDELVPGGSTHAERGITLTGDLLDIAKAADTEGARKRIVLLYSDGKPNNIDDGINLAKSRLKDQGTEVFCVGVLNTDNADDCSDDVMHFLEYSSSDYPDATSLSSHGAKGSDTHYRLADNDNVSDVFVNIAESTLSSTVGYNLESSHSVIDIISDKFTLPDGADASSIILKTRAYEGFQDGEHVFSSTLEDVNVGTGPDQVHVSVDLGTKTISVENFNFSSDKNYCRTPVLVNGTTETPQTPKGNKLVIQIPIYPSASNTGGANMNTNTSDSGIYVGGTAVASFNIPSLPLPNIVVVKNGLKKGERAMFKIEKLLGETGTSVDASFKPVTLSIISDGTSAKGRMIRVREGRYRVTEVAPWNWAYTPATDTAVTKTVDISSQNPSENGVVFEFVNTLKSKATLPVYGEASRKNDFSKN